MSFDQSKADQVVERIWQGDSLRSATKAVGIKHPTFLLWADQNPSISDQYTRAIASRADVHAERIERVVDQVEKGEIAPDQGRVMLDALKWTASKLNPRRYGDKLQLDADVRMQVELVDATAVQAVATLISKEDPSS